MPHNKTCKTILYTYLISSLFIFLALSSSAQNGSLSGQALDETTGSGLPFATINIQNTQLATVSDAEGNFRIAEVPPGEYVVECRSVGYNITQLQSVTVKPRETVYIKLLMQPAEIGLDAVVITAEVKQSAARAVTLELKKASVIKTGLSYEEIRRTPDSHVADALKRMSGVTIHQGKFAVIRGLPDRYNFAMLNDIPLPSTETDKKAFSFDLVPVNLLDNLFISKSAAFEQPMEFAGGVINMNTRAVPETKNIEVSIGTAMNTIATFRPWRSYNGGKTDFFGSDDGTRQLPSGLPDAATVQGIQSNDSLIALAKSFNNDWKINEHASARPDVSLQVSGGLPFEIKKKKGGLLAGVSFKNKNIYTEATRKFYTIDGLIRDYTDDQYSNEAQWGAVVNFSIEPAKGHQLKFNNTFTISSINQTFLRNGDAFDMNQLRQESAFFFSRDILHIHHLQGNHVFGKNNMQLKWNAAFSGAYNDIPDFRGVSYIKPVFAPEGTAFTAIVPPNSANLRQGGRFFSEMQEQNYHANATLLVPISTGNTKSLIKAGGYWTYRERVFSNRVLGYIQSNFILFDFNLTQLPQDELYTDENMSPTGMKLDEITNARDQYAANSFLQNYFAGFEWNAGIRWKIYVGVRTESFSQQLVSGDSTFQTVDTTYISILPALNIVYALNENMNLRLSGSQTVSRPEFRELAPFSFYDFSNNFNLEGNTELSITRIWNTDARWEYFFKKSGFVSMTAFFKYFKNPIEQIIRPDVGTPTNYFASFANALDAHNAGVEAEWRQKMDFSENRFFKHLTVSVNVAYIYSTVDLSNVPTSPVDKRALQGQSPYVLNAGLFYDIPKSGTALALNYNRIGRRIFLVGLTEAYPNIWEQERDVLDFQIQQKLSKNFELAFQVKDIFAQTWRFYQDMNDNGKFDKDTDRVINSNLIGRTISLQITAKF